MIGKKFRYVKIVIILFLLVIPSVVISELPSMIKYDEQDRTSGWHNQIQLNQFGNEYVDKDSDWFHHLDHAMKCDKYWQWSGGDFIHYSFYLTDNIVNDDTMQIGAEFNSNGWPWVNGPDLYSYDFHNSDWVRIRRSMGSNNNLMWKWFNVPDGNNYINDDGMCKIKIFCSAGDVVVIDDVGVRFQPADEELTAYQLSFNDAYYNDGLNESIDLAFDVLISERYGTYVRMVAQLWQVEDDLGNPMSPVMVDENETTWYITYGNGFSPVMQLTSMGLGSVGGYIARFILYDDFGNHEGTYSTNQSSPFLLYPVENHPPSAPSISFSSSQLYVNQVLSVNITSYDFDGNHIQYIIDWDADGFHDFDNWTSFYPSGESIIVNHSWDFEGSFTIRVQARDSLATKSNWSEIIVAVIANSTAPIKPNAPFGYSSISVGEEIMYSSSTYDNDSNLLRYRFDWGDGTVSNWSDYLLNNETVYISNSWDDYGVYSIRCQACDNEGAVSQWSDSFMVMVESVFDAPDWITCLKNLTNTHETWHDNHWELEIPFNTSYIPGINLGLFEIPGPFEGNLSLRGSFSTDILIKNYPNEELWFIETVEPESGHWIELPLIPIPINVIDSKNNFEWDENIWDQEEIYVKGELTLPLGEKTKKFRADIPLSWFFVSLEAGVGCGCKSEIRCPEDWLKNGDDIDAESVYEHEGYIIVVFTIKGGFGIPRVVEIGGYGEAQANINFDIIQDGYELCGDIGAYLRFFIFEKRYSLWNDCWSPSDNSQFSFEDAYKNFESSMLKEGFDDDWETITRDYGEPEWVNNPGGYYTAGFRDRAIIAYDVFPFPHVDVDSYDGKKILTWNHDNNRSNQIDSMDIQYSIWNNGKWNESCDVTNDSLFQMDPSVSFFENGDAICVFSMLTKQNITDIDEFTDEIEIGYLCYNHQFNQWSTPSLIHSTPEYLDSYVQVAADKQSAVAVWTTDEDKNMNTIDDSATYTSFYRNDSWYSTRIISTDNIVSLPISVDYRSSNAYVSYVVDADGNISTQNDWEIYIQEFTEYDDGTRVQITNNSRMDLEPDILCWENSTVVVWISKTIDNISQIHFYDFINDQRYIISEGFLSNPELIFNTDYEYPLVGWKNDVTQGLSYATYENGQWEIYDIFNTNMSLGHAVWDYTDSTCYATFDVKNNMSSTTNCTLYHLFNNKPYQPEHPMGPLNGITGHFYTYTSMITDPENDKMFYHIDWGDGDVTHSSSSYSSKHEINETHKWSQKGIYDIKIKAIDVFGVESDWSESTTVKIDGDINAPDFPTNPNPLHNADDISIPTTLSCLVTDPNNDTMSVKLILGQGDSIIFKKIIGDVIHNSRVEFRLNRLENNSEYWWYVLVNDNEFTTKSKTWNFSTFSTSKYDVNNDGIVDFQDAGLVWIHREGQATYSSKYDMNDDGVVDFQDSGLVWINRN